jgi:hypothetical protein
VKPIAVDHPGNVIPRGMLTVINDDFIEKFSNVINDIHSPLSNYRTKAMMEQILRHSYQEQATKMMEILASNNFITGLDVHYTQCSDIYNFNLEDYAEFTKALVSACERVAAMMLADNMQDNVNLRMERLHQALKTIVFSNAKGIVKTEITGAIASFASNLAVDSVLEFVDKHDQEKLAKEAKEAKEAEKEKLKQIQEKKKEVDKAYKLFEEKNANKQEFTTADDNKDANNKGNPSVNDNKKSGLPKYKVKDSDSSLWQIAKDLDISFEELIKANSQLFNVDKIWPGDIINLPKGTVIPMTTQAAPTAPGENVNNLANTGDNKNGKITKSAPSIKDQKPADPSGSCPGNGIEACGLPTGYNAKVGANDKGSTLDEKSKAQLKKYYGLVPESVTEADQVVLLGSSIYETKEKLIMNFLVESKMYNMKIELRSGEVDDKRGFFGVLFSTTLKDDSKVYFEVYKGTDFPDDLSKPNKAIEFAKDMSGDDYNLLKLKLPDQLKSAEQFHKQVLKHIGNNKNLYVTGHSLGDALSQLMGAKHINDYKAIIGVDGPGMKEIISNNLPNVNLEALQDKTVLFKAFPNRINSHGTHIVKPIAVDHPGNVIPRGILSVIHDEILLGQYTKTSHKPDLISKGLEKKDMTLLSVESWPTNYNMLSSDEQKAFFFKYENNMRAWEHYFEQEYKDYVNHINSITIQGTNGDRCIMRNGDIFYGPQVIYTFEEFRQQQMPILNRKYEKYKGKE